MRGDNRREKGQGLLEYALIILLVAAVTGLALAVSGVSLRDVYERMLNALSGKTSPASCSVSAAQLANWQGLEGNWRGGIQPAVDGFQVCQLCAGMLGGYSGSDYVLDLSGVQVENVLPANNGFGVAFRAESGENGMSGYMFEIEQQNKTKPPVVSFTKWVNGVRVNPSLGEVELPMGYDWTTSPRIQIDVRGDTFTAYLDGKPILTVKDTTYKKGGVGVATKNGTTLRFKDITAQDPACQPVQQGSSPVATATPVPSPTVGKTFFPQPVETLPPGKQKP
ncbi:hypothetical protein [Anaerolinea thermophila]|uniref:3-keto-disaccharide hydrolase domain-containing protein n=1 Tax=Anaerolinea thermophila (strain DSM 14523 / JCM 11388 / NBRC 100420 / UNI-1) TaxID=926569 RepID=E8N3D0_ANATU|nr:hypothetical protein [Anaerolinea thermophila]BAJ62944.1 hypothetical protein ANT_09100 [Anaerolinea thermophila UNI-1]